LLPAADLTVVPTIAVANSQVFNQNAISATSHNFGAYSAAAGSNRIVEIKTSSEGGGSHATGVTWGGVAATLGAIEDSLGGNEAAIWYVLEGDFPVGATGDIVVAYADPGASPFTDAQVAADTILNAAQQAPEATAVRGITSTPNNHTITTITDGALISDVVSIGNAGGSLSITQGPDQIELENLVVASGRFSGVGSSYRIGGGAGSHAMGWSYSGSPNRMSLAIVAWERFTD
jgi:hypothetical protein